MTVFTFVETNTYQVEGDNREEALANLFEAGMPELYLVDSDMEFKSEA